MPSTFEVVPAAQANGTTTFASLSAALAVAKNGDTVQVEAGSTPGSATVTQTNLTVQGDPAVGAAGLQASGTEVTGITLQGNNDTVTNLFIDQVTIGVGSTGETVSNCIVNNGNVQQAAGAGTDGGNTVTGNTFLGTASVVLGDFSANASGDQVTNNTFNNSTGTNPITVVDETSGFLISGNRITQGAAGGASFAIAAVDSSGTISDNQVTLASNAGSIGIVIQGNSSVTNDTRTTNVVISGNTVSTSGGGHGITTDRFWSTEPFTVKIENNVLSGNLVGIDVRGDGAGGSADYGTIDAGGGSTGSVGGNDLHGFTGTGGSFAITAADNGKAAAGTTIFAEFNPFKVTNPQTVVSADTNTTIDTSNAETGVTVQASNESAAFSPAAQAVQLQALVTVITGNVTFTVRDSQGHVIGTPLSGVVNLGTASVNYNLPAGLTVGPYTIGVHFTDPNHVFGDIGDTPGTLTVVGANVTTKAADATAVFSTASQTVHVNATVTDTSHPADTVTKGTVTFVVKDSGGHMIGSSVSGSVSGGSAATDFTLPAGQAAGSYSVTVSYADPTGDFTDAGDTSGTLTVSPPSPSNTMTVTNANGTVTVTDTTSGGANDNVTLQTDGTQFIIKNPVSVMSTTIPGATVSADQHTVFVPFNGPTTVSAASPIAVNTGLGNDKLTVDYSLGNFADTIGYDGGQPSSGPLESDSLVVSGGTFSSLRTAFAPNSSNGAHRGTIGLVASGGLTSAIIYSNLTPVLMNVGTVADEEFDLPNSNNNASFEASGVAAAPLQLRSTDATPTFETTQFPDPTSSLTIKSFAGTTNTITVSSASPPAAFDAALTISGNAATDTVNVNGPLTLGHAGGNTGAVSVTASVINVNGKIDTTAGSAGNVALTAGRNIAVSPGAGITSGSGNVTLEANTAGTAAGSFVGIDVNNATVQSATGSVLLQGTGGNSGISQYGVLVEGGGKVRTTGGSGTVTVQGTGGASLGGFDFGVLVTGSGSTATSGGGNVSVTGQGGGSGASGANDGVDVVAGGIVSAGGSGTVTVRGTANTTAGNFNLGVAVNGSGAEVTSGGGNVSVTGQGGGSGASRGNDGVLLVFGGVVSAGGGGTVTVLGTGGTGSGGSNQGVSLTNGQISATGTGTVSITANSTGAANAPALSADSASTIAAASTADNITLTSNNGASVAGTVTTPGGLLLQGTVTGNFSLTNTANSVARLAGSTTNANLSFTDGAATLNVATVDGVNGVSAGTGAVTVTVASAGGTLNVNQAVAGGAVIGVDLVADNLTIDTTNGSINSGTGVTVLEPFTASRAITVGTAPGTSLGLTQAELNRITAGGGVAFGNAFVSDTGNLQVTAAIAAPASWHTLGFLTQGTVTQGAGDTLSVTSLYAQGNAGVTLTEKNSVTNLSGATAGHAFSFTNTGNLAVAQMPPFAAVGIVTSGGAVALTLGGGSALTVTNAIDTTGGTPAGANITLLADSMNLGAAVNGGTGGIVTLQQAGTTTRNIDLGGGTTAGDLDLSDAALGQVTASLLRIGRTDNAGSITVTAPVTTHAGYSTLSLRTGSGVSESGTGAVRVTSLAVQAASGIDLHTNASAVATVAASSTPSGGFNLLDSLALTVGTVDGVAGISTAGGILLQGGVANTALTVNQPVTTNAGADIRFLFDHMTLGAAVTATGHRVTLQPFSAGQLIDLGTNAGLAGTLGLAQSDLVNVTAATLQVGSSTSGNLTVSNAVSLTNVSALDLETGGGMSESVGPPAGTISVANLAIRAASAVTMTNANNMANTLAANVTGSGQGFSFINSGALTIGTVDGLMGITTNGGALTVGANAGDLTVGAAITAGGSGNVNLTATAGSILNAPGTTPVITGNVLTVSAGGEIGQPAAGTLNTAAVSLTASAGDVSSQAAHGMWLANAAALTVTSASTTNGVILIDATGGDLTATSVTAGGSKNVRLRTLTSGNLVVGSVSAVGGIVGMTSAGAVTDADSSATIDVTALSLAANAATSIGTAPAPLQTAVSNLAATAGSGGLFVNNAGALTVTSVTAFGTATTGLSTNGGTITVTATGNLTISASVSSVGGPINLNAGGLLSESGSGLISTSGTLTATSATGTTLSGAGSNAVGTFNATNSSSGDISLTNTAATLTITGISESGGGNVSVTTAGNLTLPAGATVNAGGSATLTGGANNAAATITISGALTGSAVNVNGGNGGDTFNLNPSGGSTPLTANGGSGSDSFNVTPNATVAFSVHGNDPKPPANPGDTLNVTLAGTTNPQVTLVRPTPADGSAGTWRFGNRQSVTWDTIETLVPAVADLGVAKTGPATATAGANLAYTITVSNGGPSAAQAVGLSDAVPAGTTFVSATQTGGPAFTFGTLPAAGGTGTVTPTIATLAAGASATFQVVVRANANDAGGSKLANTANVSTTTIEPVGAVNAATVTTPVTTLADLAVTLSAGPSPVTSGGTLTCTVSVTNLGPSDATGVSLSDVLPAKVNFTSATPGQGSVARAGGVLAWSVGPLAAGAGATLTAVVVPYAAGTVTSTATAQGADPDPNPVNNTFTLTTTVRPFPGTIITGSDAGDVRTGADVRVTSAATGAQLFRFFAFPRSFHGGVRVAPGDVNRDGVPDLVVASGKGRNGVVRVLDGRTRAPLPGPLGSFHPFPGYKGGLYVAVGDVTGNGYGDVIVAQGSGPRPRVRVFSGADGSLLMDFRPYGTRSVGGVRVAAGDVTGAGHADIIVAPGGPGTRVVKVFNGLTGAVLSQLTPFKEPVAGGLYVAAGDVRGDGRAEVVVGQGAGGSSKVAVLDGTTGAPLGTFTPFAPAFQGGVRVGLVDVNGSGRQDILMAAGPSTAPGSLQLGPVVRVIDGLTGAAVDQFFAYAPEFFGGIFAGGSH